MGKQLFYYCIRNYLLCRFFIYTVTSRFYEVRVCQLISSASMFLQSSLIYMRFTNFQLECDLKTSVVVEMNLKPFAAAAALAKHFEYECTFAFMLECSVECVKIGNPFNIQSVDSRITRLAVIFVRLRPPNVPAVANAHESAACCLKFDD